MAAPQPRKSIFSGLGETFLAVLLGNIIYFLCVSPFLPERFQHELFRLDGGLVLDFLICAAVFGVIQLIRRKR
jgi:hypothetical protein